MPCLLCDKKLYNLHPFITCQGPCGSKVHITCITKHDELFPSQKKIIIKKIQNKDAFICLNCEEQSNKMIDIYKNNETLLVEMHKMLSELKSEVSVLKSENYAMKNEITDLKLSINNLIKNQNSPSHILNRKVASNLNEEKEKKSKKIVQLSNKNPNISTNTGTNMVQLGNSPQLESTSSSRSQTASTSSSKTETRPEEASGDGFTEVKSRRSRKPALQGCKQNSSLKISVRKPKRAFFITRLHPDTEPKDIEKFLNDEFQLEFLACTKLKTKFKTYSSFHALVNKEDFEKLNRSEVWPEGVLAMPYIGTLKEDQKYSESNIINENNDNTPSNDTTDNL